MNNKNSVHKNTAGIINNYKNDIQNILTNSFESILNQQELAKRPFDFNARENLSLLPNFKIKEYIYIAVYSKLFTFDVIVRGNLMLSQINNLFKQLKILCKKPSARICEMDNEPNNIWILSFEKDSIDVYSSLVILNRFFVNLFI